MYNSITTALLFLYFVFSAVKAHQFFSEESWDTFTQIFNNYMFEASKVFPSLVDGDFFINCIIWIL